MNESLIDRIKREVKTAALVIHWFLSVAILILGIVAVTVGVAIAGYDTLVTLWQLIPNLNYTEEPTPIILIVGGWIAIIVAILSIRYSTLTER